jgi:transposase
LACGKAGAGTGSPPESRILLTSLRYALAGGTQVAYFDFGRDVAGRIMRLGYESDRAIYYDYDSLDRLVAETWRAKSDGAQVYAFSYQYDAAGNRLAMRRETTAGAVYESSYYAYGADNALLRRREQAAGVDTYFSYDLNGALAKMWGILGTPYITVDSAAGHGWIDKYGVPRTPRTPLLEQDPFSGHLFIFFNRPRDRVKILFWDRSGFCLYYKRLEEGCFRPLANRREISAAELTLILEGIELADAKQQKRFSLPRA